MDEPDQRSDQLPEQHGDPEERDQDQEDREHRQRHHREVALGPGEGERVLVGVSPMRADAMISGSVQNSHPMTKARIGTTTRTQPVTSRRAAGFRSRTRGSGGRPGRRLRRTGPTRENRSGTPARSREHVVAVEADDGDELLEHLDLHHQTGQQEHARAGLQVGEAEGDDAPGVEVEASEVRAHPPGPAEPVGVGDVGVEGREDDVQADPDGARLGTAVPAGGGVPHLVDQRARGQDGVHHQRQRRVQEQLEERTREVGPAGDDDVHSHHGRDHEDDHRGPVRRVQPARQPPGPGRGDHGCP